MAKLTSLSSRAVFEQVLKKPPLARTEHFAIHHGVTDPLQANLSTTQGQPRISPVDNLVEKQATLVLLGLVIPKRHAARSVTRNALKRQARLVAVQHESKLAPGSWIVRLKAPFDPIKYRSASSAALKIAAYTELVALFSAATARSHRQAPKVVA